MVALLMVGCAVSAPRKRLPPSASPNSDGSGTAYLAAGEGGAVALDTFSRKDPPRLVRDLLDAQACVAATVHWRQRVDSLLSVCRSEWTPPQRAKVARALAKRTFPGCRVEHRACRDLRRDRSLCSARARLPADQTKSALATLTAGTPGSPKAPASCTLWGLP
ncbi:MAG: hypothetical protein H6686_04740 [Fibrobacteria bacterium]|nr:hypothetical protein [Fibrobacteria bacterium]